MVTIKNYIPVLRWKKAERDALATLDVRIRENITPLFELIMPAPKRDKDDYNKILSDSKAVFKNNLPSTVGELNKCCPIDSSAFVDVHLIDGELRATTLKQILDDSLTSAQVTLVPVTHIIPVVSTDADMSTRKVAVDYASSSDNGLCVRIDRYNLDDEDLNKVISDFVGKNKLDISKTDLFIDLGVISESDDAKNVSAQLARLPSLNDWRTVILSGGAFPKDLSEFEKHSHNQVVRYDWRLWNALRITSQPRMPLYSDYAIQHPIFYGQIPRANTSASVRYADDQQWEISRGEGLRNENGAGHQQYPALAQLIIEQNYFKGADYSAGDKYIAERAADSTKPGNPTTWLKAGLNHHLTLTVRQLSTMDENINTDGQ
ncbi:MAG: beta family protein [Actinomycetota bacterium]|nr:beta family protein [Actinomycetota bacterium]